MQKKILKVLIIMLVVSAVISGYAIISITSPRPGDFEQLFRLMRLINISSTVFIFSVTAICCLMVYHKKEHETLSKIGMLVSLISCIIVLAHQFGLLGNDYRDFTQPRISVTAIVCAVSIVLAYICAMTSIDSKNDNVISLKKGSCIISIFFAIIILGMNFGALEGMIYMQILLVMAILLLTGTIITLAINKVDRENRRSNNVSSADDIELLEDEPKVKRENNKKIKMILFIAIVFLVVGYLLHQSANVQMDGDIPDEWGEFEDWENPHDWGVIDQLPLETEQSRRDTFIWTARTFLSTARYQYLGGEMACSGVSGIHVIPFSQINVEGTGRNNSVSSPFEPHTITTGWVIINTDEEGVSTYAISMVDSGGNGFSHAIIESELGLALQNTDFSNSLRPNGAHRPLFFPGGGGPVSSIDCCLIGEMC